MLNRWNDTTKMISWFACFSIQEYLKESLVWEPQESQALTHVSCFVAFRHDGPINPSNQPGSQNNAAQQPEETGAQAQHDIREEQEVIEIMEHFSESTNKWPLERFILVHGWRPKCGYLSKGPSFFWWLFFNYMLIINLIRKSFEGVLLLRHGKDILWNVLLYNLR